MKSNLVSIARNITGFILFLFLNTAYGQYISNFDNNGKVKPVSQFNKSVNQSSYTPKVTPSTPASQYSTPASNNSSYKIDYAAEEKVTEEKRVKEEQRLIAFKIKVALYQNVDYYYSKNNMYSRVSLNGKFGMVNVEGDLVIPLVYDDMLTSFSGDLGWVKLDGKFGFIDEKGKVVIPIKYDKVNDFKRVYRSSKSAYQKSEGMHIAFVKLNGKCGYIGTYGEPQIPIIYDELEENSDKELIAAKLNGKWGFIDNNGDTKIAFQFDRLIKPFAYPDRKTDENTDYNGYFKKTSAMATVVKNGAQFNINIGGVQDGPKTNIFTGKIIEEASLQTDSFTDKRDNKIYHTIQIGEQLWMSQNLDVDRFVNGEAIPEARTLKEWEKANKQHKAAWCYYDNDPANGSKYGKLYNWYATTDPRGLAPEGWHIPSKTE